MASRIQLRRNTAANWTVDNPVLFVGEPAVETDTSRMKIGDGVRAWNALPYSAVDVSTYITVDQLVLSPTQPGQPQLGMVWVQTLI